MIRCASTLVIRVSITERVCSQVLYTSSGQPFLISGSGTLGWDQVCRIL